MRKVFFVFLKVSSLILAVLSMSVQAGAVTTQTATRVTSIQMYQDSSGTTNGFVYFTVENNGTRSALPSCTTNATAWFVNNAADRETEKAQVSLLMMAYSQGRPIYIQGRSNCKSGIELAEYIWVSN